MAAAEKVGILVGGGPAPGINSVIGAATIRCALEGFDVVGIKDGFEWIMQGDTAHTVPLTIESVSRIHFRGGSVLGISRANPTRDPKHLEKAANALQDLGISQLITIGGDDTAFSAMSLQNKSVGRLRIVHVPKTIDNDLDLPPHIDTFGFQTARHIGADIVKNLMVDAYTTSKWYFIISMGRKAGHLAMGIGKAAGATLTLIPEEFAGRVPFRALVDTLSCAIIKRLSGGQRHGVAIIAEGVVEGLDEKELEQLKDVERDAHGHIRISDIDIGEILKRAVQAQIKEHSIKASLIAKDIGYELRCADPIPYDMEYTRDLGYCAAKYLLSGGSAVMVSIQGGHFVPIRFDQMLDPQTGRTKVRLVDIRSASYAIARRYMIRLRRDDFEDEEALASFAATAHLSVEGFRKRYEYLVENELPPLDLEPPNT